MDDYKPIKYSFLNQSHDQLKNTADLICQNQPKGCWIFSTPSFKKSSASTIRSVPRLKQNRFGSEDRTCPDTQTLLSVRPRSDIFRSIVTGHITVFCVWWPDPYTLLSVDLILTIYGSLRPVLKQTFRFLHISLFVEHKSVIFQSIVTSSTVRHLALMIKRTDEFVYRGSGTNRSFYRPLRSVLKQKFGFQDWTNRWVYLSSTNR